MREYNLKRNYKSDRTVGRLQLSNGKTITSLELPWRDNLVGRSCIPSGDYVVKRDKHGKHQWFKVMDVPNRTFIEIHEGYKPQHSQGCILFDTVELQDLMLDCKGEDFKLSIC